MNEVVVDDERARSNRTLTMVIYGLYALGLLTGMLTSVVALIINYVKADDVRGTWLATHFRWQIRTFWYSLLWGALIVVFVLVTLGIGMVIAWVPCAVLAIWHIYRLVKGFLYLNDNKPMYPALP